MPDIEDRINIVATGTASAEPADELGQRGLTEAPFY